MINVAIDIGASSGRVIVGEFTNETMMIDEVHRFSNGFQEKEGTLYWDIDHLLQEILIGLEKIKAKGYTHCTVGIDTWAVDYVLLDQEGKRLKEIVSYRDARTDETIEKFTKHISEKEIYNITGIQFLPFNTLFQLYEEEKDILKKTDKILMVPDYLNYQLTGEMRMETTNASTTQLLASLSRDFSNRLLDPINLSRDHFATMVDPGHVLGELDKSFFPNFDLPNCQIINIASHDTASAVIGTPGDAEKTWAFLSSGTWSLLGMELKEPIINDRSLQANYTNEWGAFRTYRFLKNIMGLWVIQEVKRLLPKKYSYDELVEMAKKVKPFQQLIDLNDDRFINPENMIDEIQEYCRETKQKVPETPGELAQAVYSNLAIIYALELETLEKLTQKEIHEIYIVGGGGQNNLLNQLTATISQKTVLVGPTEATAIGNILMQMITSGEVKDIQEGRKRIRESFGLKTFYPETVDYSYYKDLYKNLYQSNVR